jgi:uncharacterized protein
MSGSGMCPACAGELPVGRGGWPNSPCACGSRAAPVCRGCWGPPFCECGAGTRPRIVREVAPPQFRAMAGAELRKFGSGECRAVGRKIVGHAAVFNRASRNLGGYVETILPHAFDGALSEGRNVQARYNHMPQFVIGDTDSGSLTVQPDATGLAYEVEPGPEHQWLLKAVQRGDVRGSSFAFNQLGGGEERWGETAAGSLIREIRSVGSLLDVAPVDSPAYPAAEAEVRMAPARRSGLDAETAMRVLDGKLIPPGPLDPHTAQMILERRWRSGR